MMDGIKQSDNKGEPNNNSDLKSINCYKLKNYASSGSSCDSSEDLEANGEQDVGNKCQDNSVEKINDPRRYRSMSDSLAIGCQDFNDSFEVFPSLPDTVLTKMGLLGGYSRERLNDEELEHKFVSLSLAFTIDGTTVADRCERQRRYRDQTEYNLNLEIERLIDKICKLQPLCVDSETTELLAGLLGQVDVIVKAAAHSSISSERFGSVQHEARLADSVKLMINHVHVLKQQRDSARRQLQYTKKVLQDSNEAHVKQKALHLNGRHLTRRRASIATITQQHLDKGLTTDTRKITRRTSELSMKGSVLNRCSRPSRLELGLDLVKIRESVIENGSTVCDDVRRLEHNDNVENDGYDSEASSSDTELEKSNQRHLQATKEFSKNDWVKRIEQGLEIILEYFVDYNENAAGRFFYQCSLICFMLALIILSNLLYEMNT